ncbi:hypothetical protein SL003B_2386 [Polymorphum gilvum SL003B-26A1]|uniref:Uncharacterized protein n=1 Tax=Polymorphum gilvum (strain LMG 25793 / CGMCC 1.9160 / SL003B-26A1) TaxID=991905 RepID=F2J1L0_POLGS|nr:hypothetical protein SL003B_2386 [Polymorphum gilvum SL003B-26A1]
MARLCHTHSGHPGRAARGPGPTRSQSGGYWSGPRRRIPSPLRPGVGGAVVPVRSRKGRPPFGTDPQTADKSLLSSSRTQRSGEAGSASRGVARAGLVEMEGL